MNRSSVSLASFTSVGELLKFVRRRARLSQRELSIAVGYSKSHISRIENNERLIDRASLLALFVPALDIQDEPETIARLLALCGQEQPMPSGSQPASTLSQSAAETLPEHHNHLPGQLTSFIGRREEMAELCHLLTDRQNRLLTLTGAGGCGKTRLALRVGEEMMPHYAHGVWLVELASLVDPQLLPKSVAAVFQLRESAERPLLSSLVEFLLPRQLLLILDNCEHLIDAVAQLLDALLHACSRLQIMATSREALALPCEAIYRVQPLALPPVLLGGRPSRAAVEGYDAIQLFVERARRVHHIFTLTDLNAPAVVRICQRLDGIPLVIELAAAWVDMLTAEQIAAHLERNFDLLTGHSRGAPSRHQTLAAALDWSYALLSEKERLLLRRLSIFVGGWTLEAAESVAGEFSPLERQETLGLLHQLVDKSLVVMADSTNGAFRFRLLETVQEFAQRKLAAIGGAEQMRDRHLAYFAELVQHLDRDGRPHEQGRWLTVLEQERDNVGAALDWAHCQQMAENELRLAAALGPYWCHSGHYTEGRRRLAAALDRNQEPSLVRAQALLMAGTLARMQHDMAEAQPLCAESLALFRGRKDFLGEAQVLENLGWICSDGDRARAICYFQESLALWRAMNRAEDCGRLLTTLAQMAREESNLELARTYLAEALRYVRPGNRVQGNVHLLNGLAELASLAGDYEDAAQRLASSLELLRAAGSKQDLAWTYCGLAENCWHRSDYQTGRNYGERSAQLFRELGSDMGLAIALHHLGLLWLALGDAVRAADCLREGLGYCMRATNSLMAARCLAGMGGVLLCQGEAKQAAQLLGAAAHPLAQHRLLLTPADLAYYQEVSDAARACLGEAAFVSAWSTGEAFGWEEKAASVLSAAGAVK